MHTFGYDLMDRVTTLPVTRTATSLASYTQRFSFSGRKTSVTELGGRSITYGYDPAYKLTSEAIVGGTPAGSVGYTHDAVGNRLTRTSTVPGVPAQSFSFDANDRLATDTYDANGNTLTSGLATYTYDFADRLLTGPGVTNVYDGDGNRVARTAAGVTTRFLIDDLTPTGYAQVAEEVVSGAVSRRYTHGPMRISQSQLIASTWTTHYFGYDAGGTVRQLTDGSGAVTDTYDYDAYGLLIAQTGSTPNLYLYRAEQWDPSLELYYLRARWMQPRTGRFVTADTYEGEDREPPSLHKYGYGEADAVNNRDPLGHHAVMEYGLVTTAVVGAVVTGTAAYYFTNRQAFAFDGQIYNFLPIAWQFACVMNRAGAWLAVSMVMNGGWFDPALLVGPCPASPLQYRRNTNTQSSGRKVAERGKCAQSRPVPPGEQMHGHHMLPREFVDFFKDNGLDIAEYVINIPESWHTAGPGGVHTGPRATGWNGYWERFMYENQNAGKEKILKYLDLLREEFCI
jgi:RHS repeat-associated protein